MKRNQVLAIACLLLMFAGTVAVAANTDLKSGVFKFLLRAPSSNGCAAGSTSSLRDFIS